MYYHLPNGRAVDIEGAVDAMLDENESNRYFLDTTTGEVGCVAGEDATTKLAALQDERVRYREVPRATREDRFDWLESFLHGIVLMDDKKLARSILRALYDEGYETAFTLLKEAEGELVDSLDIWAGDSAFETFGAWLNKQVPGVTFKGCGEHAICLAGENGAGIEGLMEAFEEERGVAAALAPLADEFGAVGVVFHLEVHGLRIDQPGDLGVLAAHAPHAALRHAVRASKVTLDHIRPGRQRVPVTSPDRDIDDQPVLGGKMADDPVGIRQDGIVPGQRCQDVRFDPHTAQGFVQQKAPQERRDGEHPGPAETVAFEKSHPIPFN